MGATLSAAQIAWYPTGQNTYVNGVYGMAGMPITKKNAIIAVAIALAESGGVVDKKSDKPNVDGSNDWGLWQINDKAHNVSQLVKTNGGANWAEAYQISSRGTDWTPWTTYTTGAYLAFMAQAATGVEHPDGGYQDKAEIPNTPASALGSLLPASWSSSATWVRVGMGIAGVVLLALVAVALAGPTAMKMTPVTNALSRIAKTAKVSK